MGFVAYRPPPPYSIEYDYKKLEYAVYQLGVSAPVFRGLTRIEVTEWVFARMGVA